MICLGNTFLNHRSFIEYFYGIYYISSSYDFCISPCQATQLSRNVMPCFLNKLWHIHQNITCIWLSLDPVSKFQGYSIVCEKWRHVTSDTSLHGFRIENIRANIRCKEAFFFLHACSELIILKFMYTNSFCIV